MNFFWDLSFSKRLLLTDDASLQTRGREETLELSFYPLFRLVDNKTKGLRHKSFGGEGGGWGSQMLFFGWREATTGNTSVLAGYTEAGFLTAFLSMRSFSNHDSTRLQVARFLSL